jgi:hypothetical protein
MRVCYIGAVPVAVPTRLGRVIVEHGDVVDIDDDLAEPLIRDGRFTLPKSTPKSKRPKS